MERNYNLQRWTVFPSGGHFAPMEERERLVRVRLLVRLPAVTRHSYLVSDDIRPYSSTKSGE